MTKDTAEQTSAGTLRRRVPGEPWVWGLFAADLAMFTTFFISFAIDRQRHIEVFAESRDALYQGLALSNTLLVLTSSFMVAVGLKAVRAGGRHARGAFLIALGFGTAFAVVKVVEWSLLIAAGYRGANQFFVYYFTITGIHFMQLCGGLAILALLAVRAGSSPGRPTKLFESGCGFWHLVDLLWLIIFSLLYLGG
ncbi:MAG: cytochrome c oxidase subunit 3 [Mycobacterium sp.]